MSIIILINLTLSCNSYLLNIYNRFDEEGVVNHLHVNTHNFNSSDISNTNI